MSHSNSRPSRRWCGLLLLAASLGSSPVSAATRSAVFSVAPDDATAQWIAAHPGEGLDTLVASALVEKLGQLTGRQVQASSAHELAAPSRRELYYAFPASTSPRELRVRCEELGVEQAFVVSAEAFGGADPEDEGGYVLRVSKMVFHATSAKPLGDIQPPRDASVAELERVRQDIGQLIDLRADASVDVVVTNSQGGELVSGARIEVIGCCQRTGGGPLSVPAGRHAVQVEADGYEPSSMALTVVEGQDASVEVSLDHLAYVVVTGRKGARVAVDGQNGRTHEPIAVSPNVPHSLLVERKGRRFKTTVRLAPAETLQVRARLRR